MSSWSVSTAVGAEPRPSRYAGGNFVVVWTDYNGDGERTGVFGHRFDRQGRLVGRQFWVNSYTTNWQISPVVTSDPEGSFAVAWSDYRLASPPDVFARRFDRH